MDFIVSIITALIAVLVFSNRLGMTSDRHRSSLSAISLLIAVVGTLYSISKALIVIPTGNIGVVDSFGKVAQNSLAPGVHLVNPFAKVIQFSTRLKDVKENVDTTSQEGLTLNLDVSLQYKLDPQKAVELYQKIGTSETDILSSRFRSTIRKITATYPANAIYSSKRQEVAKQLNQQLTQQLKSLGFIVEETLLRNVVLPETVQAAIQQKLKAEQESQQMAFVLQKERQEAERKRIEAKGLSDYQKIISQGLNAQILRLKMIEANEKLAQSPNSKIVILGGGEQGLPMILQPDATPAKR